MRVTRRTLARAFGAPIVVLAACVPAAATVDAGPADSAQVNAAGLAAGRELAAGSWGAVCGGTPVVARLRALPETYLATYSVGRGYDQYQDPTQYRDCTFDLNDAHPEWYEDPYTVCRAFVHEAGHLTAHGHSEDPGDAMGSGEYAPCRERFPRPPAEPAVDPPVAAPPAVAPPDQHPPVPAPEIAPPRERLFGPRRCSRAYHVYLHRADAAHRHERRIRACYRRSL